MIIGETMRQALFATRSASAGGIQDLDNGMLHNSALKPVSTPFNATIRAARKTNRHSFSFCSGANASGGHARSTVDAVRSQNLG